MSDEKTNSFETSNHSITPNLDYFGTKMVMILTVMVLMLMRLMVMITVLKQE